MDIGIIGAGNIGKALAKKLVSMGIGVILANSRQPETLQLIVDEIGGEIAAGTIHDAANCDIVILALPWSAIPGLVEPIGSKLVGRILIDVTNPFVNEKPVRLESPSSKIVASYFPDAILVKAFNHLYSTWIDASTTPNGARRVSFIAGDDESANASVADLISAMGFKVIDLGDLERGGFFLEPGQSLSGVDLWSHD